MITTVIRGGLGNQMFQYASAYALAKRMGQPLTLDISFFPEQTLRGYKLAKFNLSKHALSTGENDTLLLKAYKNRIINGLIRRSAVKTLTIPKGKYLVDHVGSFIPDFFDICADNVFLNGYFQSEEYFSNVRSELLDQLRPNYEPEEEFLRWQQIVQDSDSVAIHIRHGDFFSERKSSFHYILNTDYYNNALAYIHSLLTNPVFFCFSDDIEWVKQNIGKTDNFQYVSLHTEHPDIDEMMLMKNCNHIITANSTFSWWAAWLNENPNAIRIVPEKRFGNLHMIPESWIKIPVE